MWRHDARRPWAPGSDGGGCGTFSDQLLWIDDRVVTQLHCQLPDQVRFYPPRSEYLDGKAAALREMARAESPVASWVLSDYTHAEPRLPRGARRAQPVTVGVRRARQYHMGTETVYRVMLKSRGISTRHHP